MTDGQAFVENDLTYTPSWSSRIIHDGIDVTVSWCKIESHVHDVTTYGLHLSGADAYTPEGRMAIAAAQQIRGVELRGEYSQILDFRINEDPRLGVDGSELKAIADIVYDLYLRASTEFVGQVDANLLYVQDVANVLNIGRRGVLEAVKTLSGQRKIGLNGMILWDWESVNQHRTRQFERTGHKALSVSDFGWWHCAACDNGGDEMTNPKDYSCSDKEPTGIMMVM